MGRTRRLPWRENMRFIATRIGVLTRLHAKHSAMFVMPDAFLRAVEEADVDRMEQLMDRNTAFMFAGYMFAMSETTSFDPVRVGSTSVGGQSIFNLFNRICGFVCPAADVDPPAAAAPAAAAAVEDAAPTAAAVPADRVALVGASDPILEADAVEPNACETMDDAPIAADTMVRRTASAPLRVVDDGVDQEVPEDVHTYQAVELQRRKVEALRASLRAKQAAARVTASKSGKAAARKPKAAASACGSRALSVATPSIAEVLASRKRRPAPISTAAFRAQRDSDDDDLPPPAMPPPAPKHKTGLAIRKTVATAAAAAAVAAAEDDHPLPRVPSPPLSPIIGRGSQAAAGAEGDEAPGAEADEVVKRPLCNGKRREVRDSDDDDDDHEQSRQIQHTTTNGTHKKQRVSEDGDGNNNNNNDGNDAVENGGGDGDDDGAPQSPILLGNGGRGGSGDNIEADGTARAANGDSQNMIDSEQSEQLLTQ